MASAQPLAIIFDCDGVLVDSEGLASRVEAELIRELGLELSVAEAHDLFLGQTVAGVLDVIATRTGRAPTPGFTYNWAFATAHAFMSELKPVEGVRELLESLRGRGHPLAVASQSPLARVRFSLEVTGLAEYFGDHVYVTSMVAQPKPAPDVYLMAARRLGAAASDCVVVEDSPASAAGARAAGMQVFGYAPGDPSPAMRTAGVNAINDLRALVALIAALR